MSEKVSKAELYRYIAKAIDRDPESKLPPFPRRYFVHETSPGVRLYLRETDEEHVVEYVYENCLANEIMGWIKKDLLTPDYHGFELEKKHAIDAARYWNSTVIPTPKIRSITWPFELDLTFRKLPWVKSATQTPTFNEMFSRISNGRALKCFIGSLFSEESNMQQYIWLYGQGQNGKGSLSRFLHKVLGNAYSSQIPPLNGDKFWTSMILGKRLVVFPDCNNQSFVTSGLFKSLTGGDPVRIEQKMQMASTVIMTAKYLYLSNERPNISSEKADQRRIVYCEMKEITCPSDPKYDEKLWAEGGAFLTECIKIYQNDCPEHGEIPTRNQEILDDWVSTVEEELETAFEKNFKIEKDTYTLPRAFQSRLQEMWPRNKRTQTEFVKWLERKYKIRKKTAHALPGEPKVYFGITIIFAGTDVDTSQQEQRELQRSFGTGLGRGRDNKKDA